jgi:gamma-glutamyl-gamma-aminobutyrate hydrolase PuuD
MIIGIPGWLVGPNSFGLTLPYINFCREWLECSEIRILLPYSPIYTDLDLLILTGGADVNPARYTDDVPSFYTDKPDLLKEYFDVHVMPKYIEQRTPIFGICRGLQTLSVHWRCQLYQNMWHETNSADNPSRGVHNLRVLSEPNNKKIKVNSRHHQSAIILTDHPIVKILATHSSQYNHIEAIRIQDYPITAIQYHCEDLDEISGIEYALKLINEIIKK